MKDWRRGAVEIINGKRDFHPIGQGMGYATALTSLTTPKINRNGKNEPILGIYPGNGANKYRILKLENLPQHDSIRFTMRFWSIDSWDGDEHALIKVLLPDSSGNPAGECDDMDHGNVCWRMVWRKKRGVLLLVVFFLIIFLLYFSIPSALDPWLTSFSHVCSCSRSCISRMFFFVLFFHPPPPPSSSPPSPPSSPPSSPSPSPSPPPILFCKHQATTTTVVHMDGKLFTGNYTIHGTEIIRITQQQTRDNPILNVINVTLMLMSHWHIRRRRCPCSSLPA